MTLPLKITATNGATIPPNIEEEIRRKAADLDRYCDRIMSCRVTVDAPARHHRLGEFTIRLDITVPGEEIVVDRQKAEDLAVAVRESFSAARRQLEDHARRLRGDVKTRNGAPQGIVTKLFPEEGYGFLRTFDGREIYFHRNSVLSDGFDQLERGAEVRFNEEAGAKGPQASSVSLIARPHT